MSGARGQRSRPLESYYGPDLLSRLERLLFDSGKPGRDSLGERLADRLDELLIVAGVRLLAIALFVDLFTDEFLALTVFNAALSLPIIALTLSQFLDAGHELGDRSLRTRLRQWRRDRRWYSKLTRPETNRWSRNRRRADDPGRL